jgi:hypothetical protein
MTIRKMVVLGVYPKRAAATVEGVKDGEPKDVANRVSDLTSKETKGISSGRPEDVAGQGRNS